jgi:hypothetical protein
LYAKKFVSFTGLMKTAGCSARYQYRAVVPALAAPMTMKVGSVTTPPLLTVSRRRLT